MRIIESEEGDQVVKSFERALPFFGIKKDMPLILVNADIAIFESDRRMHKIIDEIETGTERPIIFYSFDSQERLEIKGHPASRLFYRSDVGFVKMPVKLEEVKKLYDLLISGNKIANPAVEAFFYTQTKQNLINILLHDFSHGKFRPNVLEKVKKEFGFIGDKEEVKSFLEGVSRDEQTGGLAKEWENKTFPGVFCDIEGTLFFENKIKKEVLDMLKKYAGTRPVTLWTGGDLEETKKKLVANGIFYPLISKYPFKGCKVEVVIDDLSRGHFEEKYKICSREYIQVNSDLKGETKNA